MESVPRLSLAVAVAVRLVLVEAASRYCNEGIGKRFSCEPIMWRGCLLDEVKD